MPLYHQIERSLLGLIRQRDIGPGELFPSENELAQMFGVTRLTIRRAVERLTEQGVLYRERGRGTFVADPSRAAAQVATGALKVLMPSMTDLIHLQTMDGIAQEARERGMQVIMAHSDLNPRLEAEQIRLEGSNQADGLILWPLGGPTDRAEIVRLQRTNVPCVLVDRYLTDLDTDYVVVDDYHGALQATGHLAQLGHRRIAMLLYEDVDVSSVRLRVGGYRQALQDHGLPWDAALLERHPVLPNATNLDQMIAIIRRLLTLPDPPTAAFCVNDTLAQALLVALHRLEVPVPQRFSIVGFDGLASLPVQQRFTTVRRATVEMGRKAAQLLIGRLDGTVQGAPQHVVLPTELVVGETSAAPPA